MPLFLNRLRCYLMVHLAGRAENRGESSSSLQVPQAPGVPKGRGQGAFQRGPVQGHRPRHQAAAHRPVPAITQPLR